MAEDVPPVTLNLQTSDIQVAVDGSSVQTLHAELHANNDAGAIRLNQIQLPFDSGRQEVKIVEAFTQKPDGTNIPIDMSAVFVRMPQDDNQSGIVSDARVKVIVFPQLAAGDTAVYTTTITNSVSFFPGKFTYGTVVRPSAPIKEERETVTAPKSMELRAETHGMEYSSEVRGDNVVHRWRYSATSGAKDPSVAVSPIEQLPRFFISNFKDYGELGRAYGKLMNDKLVVTPKVAELAEKITAGEKERREQVRKLYEWVNTYVRYIAIELGRGTMVPHDADAILTYGYGDCKDHDLLLRVLLKAKGIPSQSVLLNSSNAYSLTQVPTFILLDHVITHVPEMKLFLDSSALATPFGVLPYNEYGKPAIYVAMEGATLGTMPVLQPGVASEHTSNTMRLSAAGVLTGKMSTTAAGPSQILLRLVGLALQAVNPEQVAAQQLQARGYGGGKGTLRASPPLVRGQTYTITGEYTVPGWSEWLTGNKVTFMPIGLRILGVVGDGPMGSVDSIRKAGLNPTPCFSVHQAEDDSLEIPTGTRFSSVPTDAKVVTENIQFTAHWTVSGNTLSVHREFRSKIDQPLCVGVVRQQAIKALVEIATSYIAQIRIVPATDAPALLSKADPRPLIGPKPIDGMGEPGSNDVVAVARLGETDRTVKLINTLMAENRAVNPNDSYSTHLAHGLDYLHASQLPQAVAELSEAIKLNPDAGSEPYSARATAYSKMNKARLALADLDVALKSAPNDIALRRMHADLAAQLRDYDAAAADYNVVVKAKPDDPAIVLHRAEIRYRADKYEESAADYRRALKLGTTEADARPGLCHALARSQDQFAQAVDHCSWTLGRGEQSAKVLESRGYAYFRLGKYHEALKDFDAAAKSDPDNARFVYERGVTQVKLGNTAGRRDIDAATKQVPNIMRKVPSGLVP